MVYGPLANPSLSPRGLHILYCMVVLDFSPFFGVLWGEATRRCNNASFCILMIKISFLYIYFYQFGLIRFFMEVAKATYFSLLIHFVHPNLINL